MNERLKIISIVFLGLIASIIAIGLFVFPGIYKYDSIERGGEKTPVKINRFTGKAEAYTLSGWRDLGDKKTSPAE